MKKQFILGLILAASLGGQAVAADAIIAPAEPAAPAVSDKPVWALQITPYMWASGIRGDISPFRRAPTIGIEKSFGDIMKDLNFGGFVDLWGRYDRFVFSADAMYIYTTDGQNIRDLPVIGNVQGLSASVDSKQFTAALKGGYRFYDDDKLTLDVLGGVRIWHVSNDVTIDYRTTSVTYGESFSWVDPLLGLRAFYNFSPKFSVQAQADFGGFSVGSKQTWQALATVNYAFTEKLSASLGYKVLSVNYDKSGHVFDTTLKGPVVGVTYRF